MLTQEQIQNLKPGDPLIIHGTYKGKHSDGDLRITSTMTVGDSLEDSIKTVHPSCVSLPSEHGTSLSRRSSVGAETEVPTTTRLFKKGDVVTPRIYLGRKDKGLEMGEKYIVTADEIAGDMVAIKHHFTLRPDIVQTCFLELVTPVEELERYVVEPGDIAWFVVDKKHKSGELNVVMYMNTHPNPKAAAEAECARMNAEWRKEHPHA